MPGPHPSRAKATCSGRATRQRPVFPVSKSTAIFARAQQTSRPRAYKMSPACRSICLRRRAKRGTGPAPKRKKAASRIHKFRCLAPTGTIAFMMDYDTTGVEPNIAQIKYKSWYGGGLLKIINNTVPRALRRLGYDVKRPRNHRICRGHGTIEGAPNVKDEDLSCSIALLKPKRAAARYITWAMSK